MSKIKNGGLDQYGAESFEQQQFGRAGVDGVNFIFPVCPSSRTLIIFAGCDKQIQTVKRRRTAYSSVQHVTRDIVSAAALCNLRVTHVVSNKLP